MIWKFRILIVEVLQVEFLQVSCSTVCGVRYLLLLFNKRQLWRSVKHIHSMV